MYSPSILKKTEEKAIAMENQRFTKNSYAAHPPIWGVLFSLTKR